MDSYAKALVAAALKAQEMIRYLLPPIYDPYNDDPTWF